jgi:hypothetical protein
MSETHSYVRALVGGSLMGASVVLFVLLVRSRVDGAQGRSGMGIYLAFLLGLAVSLMIYYSLVSK